MCHVVLDNVRQVIELAGSANACLDGPILRPDDHAVDVGSVAYWVSKHMLYPLQLVQGLEDGWGRYFG